MPPVLRRRICAQLVSLSLNSFRPASLSQMGRRGRKKQESKGEPGEWVKETRSRLQDEEHERDVPAGSRTMGPQWQAAADRIQESRRTGRGSAIGASRPLTSSLERLALEYSNIMLKSAVRLQSFEPLSNVTMVCGRPVQVIVDNASF